jgi:hypothetical protein
MSFLGQPSAPDPNASATGQLGYSTEAAKTQQGLNSYNQINPFGSQTYTADPSSPSGYSLNTALSGPLQNLFNINTGTAGNIASSSSNMYSNPFDLNASTGATAGLLNKWQQQYLDPLFRQQQSNTDSQLHNQGLAPGSEAYNNAQNLLARNQGDITNQYLTMNEGNAFNQALQQYQLPLQTEFALRGLIPSSPSFAATPTTQVQAPNYQQAVQNQYQAQQNQFQNMIGGLGQVAGLVAAPFTGGLSMVPGMLGGGWGGSSGNYGGTGGGLGGLY